MPMTKAELFKILSSAVDAGASAKDPYAEGAQARQTSAQEAGQNQAQLKLKDFLQGQTEKGRMDNAKSMLNDPKITDNVNSGGSYSVNPETGAVSIGGNPYAKMGMQAPHQAQAFLKTAQGAYKGINDQADAAQGTLDALNQGNATSDKIALINEARIAAGSGGSRAIGQMVDVLSGGKTAAGDFQDKVNWLQNTPNIPTLQPAQRDAMRESVFGRLGQLNSMKTQTDAQLAQQGPVVAPQADTQSLIQSFSTPISQKLQGLQKAQSDYMGKRQQMQQQGSSPVSSPSTANPNETTMDKLKGFFGIKPSQQQQAQPATTQIDHSDAMSQELAKRAQQSLNQPTQQGQAPQGQ